MDEEHAGRWVATFMDGEDPGPIVGPFETMEDCVEFCNRNTPFAIVDVLSDPARWADDYQETT